MWSLTTSFPGSFILPPGASEERPLPSLAPGGKMRDPGNEVGSLIVSPHSGVKISSYEISKWLVGPLLGSEVIFIL